MLQDIFYTQQNCSESSHTIATVMTTYSPQERRPSSPRPHGRYPGEHKGGTPSLGIRDDQKGKDLPAHQGCRTRFAVPCELCLKQQLALPVGWSAHVEESGRTYFSCDSKGRSSWQRPAVYGPDGYGMQFGIQGG